MSIQEKKVLEQDVRALLIQTLATRFHKNNNRHLGLQWSDVLRKLEENPEKLWSLQQMESTGGEPDVVAYDPDSDQYTY